MPFIVQNGRVYMNGADIAQATIGSASIASLTADKLIAGTVAADDIRLGGQRFVLNAGQQQLVVNDGTRHRVVMGALGGGQYGLNLYDSAGNLVFRWVPGGAVPVSALGIGRSPPSQSPPAT